MTDGREGLPRYRDSELVMASQIAYMDFDYSRLSCYKNATVGAILEYEIGRAKPEEAVKLRALQDRIRRTPGAQGCEDWVIRQVMDDQNKSGMYACLLETGEGEALMAFRGSESDSKEQIFRDWIMSDLGLLDNQLTPQQKAAEDYTRAVYETYGDRYRTFSMTGHSLGGCLAEHAAVTAPDPMRASLGQCVNLDGPGVSGRYRVSHAGDIRKSEGLVDHYRWSLVGTLLGTVPGSRVKTVLAETPDKGSGPLAGLTNLLYRHDTNQLVFDEKGMLLDGKTDPLARSMGEYSRDLDRRAFWTRCMHIWPAAVRNLFDQKADREEVRMTAAWAERDLRIGAGAVWGRKAGIGHSKEIGAAAMQQRISVDFPALEGSMQELSDSLDLGVRLADRLGAGAQGPVGALGFSRKLAGLSDRMKRTMTGLSDLARAGNRAAVRYRETDRGWKAGR